MRRKEQNMKKEKLKNYTHGKLNKRKTILKSGIALIVIFLIVTVFVSILANPILRIIKISGKETIETNAANVYQQDPFTEEYSIGAFSPPSAISDYKYSSGFAHVGEDTDDSDEGDYIYIGTNTSKDNNVYRDTIDGFRMGTKLYDMRTYFWLVEGDDYAVWGNRLYGSYIKSQQEGDTFSDGYQTEDEETVIGLEVHFYESGTLNTSNPKEVSVKGIGCMRDVDRLEGYKFLNGVNNNTGIWLTNDTTIIPSSDLSSAGLTNPYTTDISNAWFGTIDNNLDNMSIFYQFNASSSSPLRFYHYGSTGWHSSFQSETIAVTYHISGDEPDTGLGKGEKNNGSSGSILDQYDYLKDKIYVAKYGTYTVMDALSADGYTFTGWNEGSINGTNYSGRTVSPLTGNLDLYGNFTKNVTTDAPFDYEPHLEVGQDNINVHYTDLVEYNDGANGGEGTPKPYNCVDRNVKALCNYGNHYYVVVSYTVIGDPILISGGEPTLSSNTDTVAWSRYNDSEYKVGPYNIDYTGTIESVVITTDKGSVTLTNNSSSSDGNYRVDNIVSGQDFYIYINKSLGAREVVDVKVKVQDTSVYREFRKYILECYEVDGSHYDDENDTQYDCTNPDKVQKLEHYQYDDVSKTVSKEITLPGALGIIRLKIVKRDKYNTDILVQGAKYELWSDGQLQYSGTTDENGTATIDEVLIGDYSIREVEVPDGYEIEGYATWDGKTYTDLTNMTGTLDKDTTIEVYNESYIDLGGKVFVDNPGGKGTRENGYYDDLDDPIPGIPVTLHSTNPDSPTETVNTDSDGNYIFEHKSKQYQYYLTFEYNGQVYEPTTYNVGEDSDTPDRSLRSYATETPSDRDEFNEKFSPVDSSNQVPAYTDTSNSEFLITAYTGPSGKDNIVYYDSSNTEDETTSINLGLLEREKFDLNLRKDVVNVQVSINGKNHTYEYPGSQGPLDVDMRGTDVAPYEREISKSDLGYTGANKLQILVTYIIQISNESNGEITGYVTDLNDFYDTSFTVVRSWDENNQEIQWQQSGTVSGSGKTYNKMHTTSLANVGITDRKNIYIQYQVSDQKIKELFDSSTEYTEENLAEIAGYRNTYTKEKQDLNGNTIAEAGEVAGLIDIDSTPNNMNPVSSTVQNFINESKTENYQNLSSEEKTSRSRAVFEDDADYAPGLKIIPGDLRTISGTVFEDSALADKLQQNERIGDGELTSEDTRRVNKVKVELICVEQNAAGEWVENSDVMDYYASTEGQSVSQVTVQSNENGEYTVSGYIPGDYIIRFTYGDKDCLQADQNDDEMYTGQDYKSTLYFRENYEDDNNDWYKDETPRTNDATDNQTRREEVNSYSRTLQYSNATILDSDKNSSNIDTLADKTSMYADTALMSMQVEYLENEDADYSVNNVDFGIIERPRTTVVLQKNVETVKLTAVDGSTIFDSSDTAPDLTWVRNSYNDATRELDVKGLISGTVDTNLLYGSTAKISYSFKIINDSEIDYNDLEYYERGTKPDDSKLNKINVNKIIDYVPNVFRYDENGTKERGEIIINENSAIPEDATGTQKPADVSLWDVKKDTDTTLSDAEFRASGNELLAEDVFNDVNNNITSVVLFPGSDNYPTEITSLIDSDPTQSEGLLRPNGEIKLKNALTISGLIANDEALQTNGTPDENIAEIIQLTIDNGRRPYYESTTSNAGVGGGAGEIVTETPGNANPMIPTSLTELDTAISEEVQFIPPFGQNRQLILIIVIISALGIIGIAVYVIKKKVLLK